MPTGGMFNNFLINTLWLPSNSVTGETVFYHLVVTKEKKIQSGLARRMKSVGCICMYIGLCDDNTNLTEDTKCYPRCLHY